ncbi:MAG: helix-turn-helix transcriptional regulator [Eubacteriales bacterium]
MTVGEKIKFYRKTQKLSQKELGELSGVSTVSIQKYESGERNPKPEQLKKLAKVLEVADNIFLDISPSDVDVSTVGDVMSLLYLLKDKLGWSLEYGVTENNSINPDTICIHFSHDRINECLSKIALEDFMVAKRLESFKQLGEQVSQEFLEEQAMIDSLLTDVTREEFSKSDEPLE